MSVISTKEGINGFRMSVLLTGLSAELKGIRMTRGRTCYSIIKQEFGLKGNKQKVYDQFKALKEQYDKDNGFS